MSEPQDGSLNQDVDPTLGASNRFDRDEGTFAKSQMFLIAFFGFLFLATCFCCRKHISSSPRRRRFNSEEEDDGLTPEERESRRTEIVKTNLKTRKWKPPVEEKRDIEAQTIDDVDQDENDTPMSSRLSFVLQNTSSSFVKTVSKMGLVDHEKPEYSCAICLNEYIADEVVAYSDHSLCCHEFHENCITNWLMKHKDCPLCRNVFLMEDNENERQSQGDEASAEHEAQESSVPEYDLEGNTGVQQQGLDTSIRA